MKKIFKTFTLAITAAFLTACGGSTGDLVGLNPVVPTNPNANMVLKKVNYHETGSAAYDINYQYTAGKLTSVTTSDNSYSFAVEYTGNQISKITRTFNDGVQTEVIVSNLVYTGNTITKINGTLAVNGTTNTIFTTNVAYTGGRVTQVKTETFLPGTTVNMGTITTDIEYAGTNISKTTFTEQMPSGPTNVTVANYSNYDASPNPFRTLPTAYTLVNTNWELDVDAPIGLSTNNAKTIAVQNVPENITYTYDATNYPTQATGSSAILKFEYVTL